MTNRDIKTTLNEITIDCVILVALILPGLLIFGNYKEHDDSNSGSMYGLYIFPATPIILISLGMTVTTRAYFKPRKSWLGSLTPLILIIPAIWLNYKSEIEILITVVLITIVYSAFKPMVNRQMREK
jgi:ABC-type transport system involved in cytochrome c biogenesis permease component